MASLNVPSTDAVAAALDEDLSTAPAVDVYDTVVELIWQLNPDLDGADDAVVCRVADVADAVVFRVLQ